MVTGVCANLAADVGWECLQYFVVITLSEVFYDNDCVNCFLVS